MQADLVEPITKSSANKSEPAPVEQQLRIDLAAAYRLIALRGWDDEIANHISVRLPGPERHFLINPFGTLYSEMTASMLVKIDHAGNIVHPGSTGLGINKTGFIIHSALHQAREDVQAILHCHTTCGTAVSVQRNGLLPLSPSAMLLIGKIGYHDFEGASLDEDEQPRLARNFADNWVMILRNHGTLSGGRTLAEAYQRMYWLERACEQQVAAMSGGSDLLMQDAAMAARLQGQSEAFLGLADLRWAALLRQLDRIDPSYRN